VDGDAFQKTRGELTPEAKQYHQGVIDGQEIGRREGIVQERARILTVLETMHLDPKVKRGSSTADSILAVVNALGKDFRAHAVKDGDA
jgi:hypothetical protein